MSSSRVPVRGIALFARNVMLASLLAGCDQEPEKPGPDYFSVSDITARAITGCELPADADVRPYLVTDDGRTPMTISSDGETASATVDLARGQTVSIEIVVLEGDTERVVASASGVVPASGNTLTFSEDQMSVNCSETFLLPQMVPVPAGTFVMGSPEEEPERRTFEGPQRQVAIQAFELAVNEVTFDEYDLFVQAIGGLPPSDQDWGRGERPVINVSWDDAQAYIGWLNAQTGENFRLPTEAEWEYAARAGTTSPFYTGNCIDTEQANYIGDVDYNGCGANTGLNRALTVRVSELNAAVNPFGLRHMAGNVWEWTQDCWHGDYTNAPVDGSAWLESDAGECDRRVMRGGGWNNIPARLRSADRGFDNQSEASNIVGFRLARTPFPESSAR